MREFRFLDEKRKMNGLTPPEEVRWQELGAALGIDLTAGQQPTGYYGPDGLWYQYPPGYDANAAWAQQQWQQQQQQQAYYPPPQQQPYYDPNTGAYYPPQQPQYAPQYAPAPQGYYDPNTGAYYPPEAYQQQQQPAPQQWEQAPQEQQPAQQWDPAQQQQQPAQQWDPAQQQQQPPQWDPAQQQLQQPQWDYSQQQPAAEPQPESWEPQAQSWEPELPVAAPEPEPVYAPEPIYAPPEPAYAPPAPVFVAPAPAFKAPIFVAPVFVSPAATLKPRVEPIVQAPAAVEPDDVMEISDEEVLEVPVTAPPATTSPMRPAPAPLPPVSLDSVEDLHGALLDEDLSVPVVRTGPLGISSNTAITQLDAATAKMLSGDVGPGSSPSGLLSVSDSAFMPALDDLTSGTQAEPPAPNTADFLPSMDDLTISEPEPTAAPVALMPELVAVSPDFSTPLADAVEPIETKLEPLSVAEPAAPAEATFESLLDLPAAEPAPVAPAPLSLLAEVPEVELPVSEVSWDEAAVVGMEPELPSAEAAPLPLDLPEPASWDQPVETVSVVETFVEVAPLPQAAPIPLVQSLEPVSVQATVSETVREVEPEPVSWDQPVEVAPAPEPEPVSWDQPVEVAPAPEPEPVSWDQPVEVAPPPQPEPVSWDQPIEVAPAPQPEPVSWDQPVEVAPAPQPEPVSWDQPVEVAPAPAPEAVPWDQPDEVAAAPAPAPLSWDQPVEIEATVTETVVEATVEPLPELDAELAVEAPAVNAWETNAPQSAPSQVPFADALSAPPHSSSSAFDLLAMPPESAPRIPTFTQPAPAPWPAAPAAAAARTEIFASSWENEAPVEPVNTAAFGTAWDNEEIATDDGPMLTGTIEPELTGAAGDSVELASASDFLPSAPTAAPSEEISIDSDPGEFVVESASAAELATDVREGAGSSIEDGQVELASNSDFIDHSQLTGTGASWSDDRNSIPLEEEEDEVIQGTVLEEEPEPAPEPSDSWGAAVSQPSTVPQAVLAPPVARAQPPRAALVPPLAEPMPAPVAPRVAVAAPSVPSAPPSIAVQAQPAAQQSVAVPGEHRVILHTIEGQVKRGAIKDARLGEPQLQLQLANGGNETLPRERVKALFFMLAPGARAPSTEGNKVRVTFRDGRQVAGFSKDHASQTAGFFVVPADNRTNTERIFIFRHAVQSIAVEK